MRTIVKGGMKWEEVKTQSTPLRLDSEDNKYCIMKTKQAKFRLIAFDHDPSSEFPEAEWWMREYATLEQAAEQAEKM